MAGADETSSTKMLAAAKESLPQYPGENFHAHAAAQYKEDADARLAALGLKGVAQGHDPPGVRDIIDIDLSLLPALPVDHKDYYRNNMERMRAARTNAANREKRFVTRMKAWTDVYTLFKLSTEKSAPMLSRELLELCDLEKIHGSEEFIGYYDGPRSYRIVPADLLKTRRSHADKEFYRAAERLRLQAAAARRLARLGVQPQGYGISSSH